MKKTLLTLAVALVLGHLSCNIGHAAEAAGKRDFMQAIENRRTYYSLSNTSPIPDAQIKKIVDTAVLHVPSAFNMQSSRVVLLLGDSHKKFWSVTRDCLKKTLPEKDFSDQAKLVDAYAGAYGTILFYEDQVVVKDFQNKFPQYEDSFPVWSQEASAMHQFAVWTMLCDAGLGASIA